MREKNRIIQVKRLDCNILNRYYPKSELKVKLNSKGNVISGTIEDKDRNKDKEN
jgi:hypothetical protein